MDTIYDIAKSQLGVPYFWGGANPVQGFDCSGFVQWVLRAAGLDLPGKQNAQQLYDQFEKNSSWNVYALGALAFYGKSVTEITHVALLINQYQIIEAAGGNHLTLTKADAAAQNACVRASLVKYRSDLVAVLKPNYSAIGCL